ncbi:N-anthranilate isomerase protein [Halorhabdus tiamatea SARL4B]|uniref:N-(5'-phosphoribosyl)anthranilate isomerase n=1 Tax=Halorhabdus tiamatea SARL4B TaxID=1033806 RepID=F7PQI6_9EURY|nr:phosphoribosylanthranilate isomerase [Halorhabdus tiamatea]ERJ04873.1 N-anthranilate isomerase protein [Halorhabdus tiamatea SARL4B]CCQ33314.1 phosphoribosylanthranilate isomerase [Halorhabdus tiamatea SARL4B]
MTRVKVCGHTREADVRASVDAGVDAIGVISDVPVETPREVSRERATELLEAVPPLVSGVLVTMSETVEAARELAAETQPDAVQIHGTLDPDEVAALAAAIPQSVLVALDHDADLDAYAAAADGLVVDSLGEAGGGGTGRTHDWDRTAEVVETLDVPILLAGGLTPENVAEAVETIQPFGVDTASGVELEGGVKDHDAVERFVDRVESDQVVA